MRWMSRRIALANRPHEIYDLSLLWHKTEPARTIGPSYFSNTSIQQQNSSSNAQPQSNGNRSKPSPIPRAPPHGNRGNYRWSVTKANPMPTSSSTPHSPTKNGDHSTAQNSTTQMSNGNY